MAKRIDSGLFSTEAYYGVLSEPGSDGYEGLLAVVPPPEVSDHAAMIADFGGDVERLVGDGVIEETGESYAIYVLTAGSDDPESPNGLPSLALGVVSSLNRAVVARHAAASFGDRLDQVAALHSAS